MPFSPNRGQIRPKFSSMPRQQTEAAAFLDSYKLTVEKKRLQQELDSLNQRRDQILQRLSVIDRQVETLETRAATWRQQSRADRHTPTHHTKAVPSQPRSSVNSDSSTFETFVVDY